jgi:hypothetical protein
VAAAPSRIKVQIDSSGNWRHRLSMALKGRRISQHFHCQSTR